ncbi:hypothetical protein ACP0HM_22555 [Escherichia coli]
MCWAKTSQKSGAGTKKTELKVAGKKNAALFEWAAFVKAEKVRIGVTSYSIF